MGTGFADTTPIVVTMAFGVLVVGRVGGQAGLQTAYQHRGSCL